MDRPKDNRCSQDSSDLLAQRSRSATPDTTVSSTASSSPSLLGRSSFSSVRENEIGTQAFTSSRISSYDHASEEEFAIAIDSPSTHSPNSSSSPTSTTFTDTTPTSTSRKPPNLAFSSSSSSSQTPSIVGRGGNTSLRPSHSPLALLPKPVQAESVTKPYPLGPKDSTPSSSATLSYAPSTQSPASSTTSSTSQGSTNPGMEFVAPLTQPHSQLHGSWKPASSFRGWKQIQVKGKYASRSFSDLQALNMVWNLSPPTPSKVQTCTTYEAAPLERLPIEVLVVETPTNSVTVRNADLMALLMTSRTLHFATLATLYRHVTIPHSKIFRKFLTAIQREPELGKIVRRLDFNHFNPGALFSTNQERALTQNLTYETLLMCLELTPNLREFLAQEHVAEDMSPAVLRKLLFDLPRLRAIDFCGCSDRFIKSSLETLIDSPAEWPEALSISRLSFHKCLILPSTLYDTMLPRLTRLTHLDLAGCRVTDSALAAIPHTARVTHLNLAKCRLLTSRGVLDFLSNHPAVKDSLVVLSLATDATSHQLFNEDDVTKLLDILPSTLRSLSLKGSRMNVQHLEQLKRLVVHLEELALGRNITIQQIETLFISSAPPSPPPNTEDVVMTTESTETPTTSAPSSVALANDPQSHPPAVHALRYLDVSDLFGSTDLLGLFDRNSVILKPQSAPLAVIEVSELAFSRLRVQPHVLISRGWSTSEQGDRYWFVRYQQIPLPKTTSSPHTSTMSPSSSYPSPRSPTTSSASPSPKNSPVAVEHDSGSRWWKMGATFWGMRKFPVAQAEVGGMYGSFMFSRKL